MTGQTTGVSFEHNMLPYERPLYLSPTDSCFYEQKKRLLLLLVADYLLSVPETENSSLSAFMSLYCLPLLMFSFIYLIMTVDFFVMMTHTDA